MAELADAPDLGSGAPGVQVQVLLSASRVASPCNSRVCGFFLFRETVEREVSF